mmetsp:Transcript_32060/g.76519  ORF Transcript_32060/g.76519 Transcript_32060/m.76519 type:complete len:285 (+) Transcript_32060:976-1830(+)
MDHLVLLPRRLQLGLRLFGLLGLPLRLLLDDSQRLGLLGRLLGLRRLLVELPGPRVRLPHRVLVGLLVEAQVQLHHLRGVRVPRRLPGLAAVPEGVRPLPGRVLATVSAEPPLLQVFGFLPFLLAQASPELGQKLLLRLHEALLRGGQRPPLLRILCSCIAILGFSCRRRGRRRIDERSLRRVLDLHLLADIHGRHPVGELPFLVGVLGLPVPILPLLPRVLLLPVQGQLPRLQSGGPLPFLLPVVAVHLLELLLGSKLTLQLWQRPHLLLLREEVKSPLRLVP